MATFYFILFVATCIAVVFWAVRQSRAKADLTRRRTAARMAQTGKLSTPAVNVFSDREEVWRTRQQAAVAGIERTNRFVPRSDGGAEPLYDGYSRRDRHHVKEPTAKVDEGSQVEAELRQGHPIT